ncbi:MAG: hypothetical protein NC914_01095 [Candidatus Omnitrophica bacterium]|nr:hypothetical protein [Candidatus Omnitrophota bacterium]
MEQKKMFTLVGIGAAVLVVGFFIMNLSGVNQKLTQENKELRREYDSLKKKNESLAGVARDYEQAQAKIRQLNEELDRVQRDLYNARDIAREKEELQRKYEEALKAKNELAARLSKATVQQGQESLVPRPMVSAAAGSTTSLGDDLYWAAILKEKTDLEVALSKVNDELKTIKAKFDQEQKAKSALEMEIKNIKELEIKNLVNQKLDLERRVAYSERTIDSLSLELVREKKDNRKLKEDYKALEAEKTALRNEIGNLRNEISSLNNQIKGLNESKLVLEDKLQKIELSKQDLERRIMAINALLDEKTSEIMDMKQRLDLIKEEQGLIPKQTPPARTSSEQQLPRVSSVSRTKASVELPPIVVKPDSSAPAQTGKEISGRILEINDVNKFVIIDLGEDAGLRPGDILGVYKGNTKLANIEVIQTRRSISAADIKQIFHPIKVGDTVK